MFDPESDIDEYEDKFDCDYKVESERSEDYDEESDEEEEMKDKKQMKIDFRSKDIDVCPPVYGKKPANNEYF